MAKHLADQNCAVSLVSFASEQPLLKETEASGEGPSVTLVRSGTSLWEGWQSLSRFEQVLREKRRRETDVVVHDNGVWRPVNHRVATTTRSLKSPRVVSPHGMLEPWSLKQKKWKKKAAWWLYQKHDLQAADVVVATAEQEAQNIRALGIDRPIAVIPNGVDRPDALPCRKPDTLGGKDNEPRVLLFLSRIHEKKGLLSLVEAWNRIRPEGWTAVIAGPDEGDHKADVQERITEYDLTDDFAFTGPVQGTEKWGLYQSADLFVLPTHSENFGIVVAEALSCGTPVITTQEAPWSDLLDYECGWWVEVGVDPLAAALREALSLPSSDLRAIGERGIDLVKRKYTWPRVAEALKETYRWVLGERECPEHVFT